METPKLFQALLALSFASACAVSELDVGPDEVPGLGGGSGGGAPSGGGMGGKKSGSPSGGSTATGGSSSTTGGSGGASVGAGGETPSSGGSAGVDAGSTLDATVDVVGSDPKALIQVVCGACPLGFTLMNGLIEAPKNDACSPGAACGTSYQNLCVKNGHLAKFGCTVPFSAPWVHVVDVPNCDGYCTNGFYEVWVLP